MNFRARLSSYFSLKKDKEDDKGLTLLEIAGAMIIIAIVVALAMSQMSSTMASSDNQRELKNLQTIEAIQVPGKIYRNGLYQNPDGKRCIAC